MHKLLILKAALASCLAAINPIQRQRRVEFCNIAEGEHADGVKSYLADASHGSRFLVVKIGTDANHVALAAAADTNILGICTDQPSAAEDLVAVRLIGSGAGTVRVVASAAITAGADVVSAASGKVRTIPGTTGSYFVIGKALEAAAADGDIIQIAPLGYLNRVP
jgi:hypothetical protein